jgi:alkanesulfonate monooxygenase SsuD/methylene tetrahydromethanopterin reductase-like flavin-dependent oxidoreductase (luciferase family)
MPWASNRRGASQCLLVYEILGESRCGRYSQGYQAGEDCYLGNVILINDPVRMAEEFAMLDCYSGGRIISGFVRGTAQETLQAGISPVENRERFEEAHDLIIKCWTTPGPFRWEGKYFHYRVVNPWVVPIQKLHPPISFPGTGSLESVIWAATHRYPYMNLGALLDLTEQLKQVYVGDGLRGRL